jgi:uncharacterized protein YjbI with pentapeptide repeats
LAYQRHMIAILACGAEEWNAFRREHSGSVVLHGATLADAQLSRADLRCAILMESDLRRANLACAILERAVLRKSDFRDSNLRQANISGADLWGANLAGADLRDASLASCFLKRADLRGTDLSTARGLTEDQIKDAVGDAKTKLPAGLARPANWEC